MSEIEILGKIQNYLKVFKSIDEFNLYYAKNKEENNNEKMKQFDESINDLKMKVEDMMMKINKIGDILQTHQSSINNLIKNYNSLIEKC